MATNNFNPNNSLATRSSENQLQKYIDHPLIKGLGKIVKLEESVKTAWSNECVNTAIRLVEFEFINKYDQNHS